MSIKGWDGREIPISLNIVENSTDLAIMIHGIFSEKEEDGRFTRLAGYLANLGISSIRYDQRCHGSSNEPNDQMSIANHVLDLASIVQIARTHAKNVHIIASSYGAAVSLLASGAGLTPTISRYILLNPVLEFDYVFVKPIGQQIKGLINQDILEKLNNFENAYIINGVTFSPVFWTELHYLKPSLFIKDISSKITLIHGNSDTAVDYKTTLCIGKSAGISDIHTIEGSDHSFVAAEHEAKSFEIIGECFARWN